MDCTVLECIARLAQAGFTSWGCPPDVDWHWTPPASGTPAVSYVYEVMMRGAVGDTTLTVPLPDGIQTMEFRVAGVDSLGRQGMWSEWGRWETVR